MNDFFYTHEVLLQDVGLTALMALALYLTFQVGLFSLAHVGFATLGAYGAAILYVDHSWPWLAAVGVTLAAVAVSSYLLCRIVQHLRGVYMALATLAFSQVVNLLCLQLDSLTGGAVGMTVPRVVMNRHIFWVCVVAFTAAAVVSHRTIGREAVAIRHARQQARMGGVPVLRHERAWFVVSSLLAAVAGTLTAFSGYFITPDSFGFEELVAFLSVVIVGGAVAWAGPLVGTGLLVVPPDLTSMDPILAQILFSGVALVLVALLAPRGVVPGLATVARRMRKERRTSAEDVATTRPVAVRHLVDRPDHGAAKVIVFDGLTRSYGGVHALSGVSGSVAAGEICGLIGPNGAGKTTLVNMLSGIDRPDSGSISVNGIDLTGRPVEDFVRAGVGRTFQLAHSFGELSVRDNIALSLRIRSRLGRPRPPWLDGRTDEVDQLLHLVGLSSVSPGDRAGGLPYGVVRRLELARTLALAPTAVLLDEPLAGAPEEAEAIAACIERLAMEGAAVLLVEHDIAFVFGLAHNVVALDAGVPIASGAPDRVREDPLVQAAYLGTSEGSHA